VACACACYPDKTPPLPRRSPPGLPRRPRRPFSIMMAGSTRICAANVLLAGGTLARYDTRICVLLTEEWRPGWVTGAQLERRPPGLNLRHGRAVPASCPVLASNCQGACAARCASWSPQVARRFECSPRPRRCRATGHVIEQQRRMPLQTAAATTRLAIQIAPTASDTIAFFSIIQRFRSRCVNRS
jgi:hypothetical protein